MMKQIDWEIIQVYYDDSHTWRDIQREFNIANATICKAVKNGFLKCRSKSDANTLASQLRPRVHTEETKAKISKSRLAYLRANPDKVPYLLNHYSKGASYPERYFNALLERELIYERYKQVSIYNLDFAFPSMVDLEIDGEQHYSDQRIVMSNKRRDKYLSGLGWRIIRVRWSTYKRLSDKEKQIFVSDLLQDIMGS